MVATAANTYIFGNQFTFKWNFNIGERSHTESLIYMKTLYSREEKCTCSHNLQRQETKQTVRYMFVSSIIYLHLEEVGKDGEKGGREKELGGSASQACQLSCSWPSRTHAFGWVFSLV